MPFKKTFGVTHRFVMNFALPFKGDMCLIWPFARNSAGYGHYSRDKVHYLVHRLICRLRHGEPPSESHFAIHTCGKGHTGCCNPNHLRWATPSENTQDRWNHGTFLHGERAGAAKLTDDQARQIRMENGTHKSIAARYGVCQQTVTLLKSGKTWKHVK